VWIDIVFSGGGVKGFAFVGALDVLEKSGYRFRRAAGTSAGAIVAALLAAGCDASELRQLMNELDASKLLDPPSGFRFPFYKWLRLYFRMGLYRGDALEHWLVRTLEERGITSFADLPDGALKIVASDVSRGRLLVLPDDLEDYGIYPSTFPVARAVRMSIGLPFFFEPVSLFDGNGKRSLIVDGGLLSNFPIWIFEKEGARPLRPFLGLQATSDEAEQPQRIGNAVELFRGIFTTMQQAHDARAVDELKQSNVIRLPIGKIKITDFAIAAEEKERLFRIGVKATQRFLKKWTY
jgi:NTE family protein